MSAIDHEAQTLIRDVDATEGTVSIAGRDIGALAEKKIPQLRRNIGTILWATGSLSPHELRAEKPDGNVLAWGNEQAQGIGQQLAVGTPGVGHGAELEDATRVIFGCDGPVTLAMP